MRFLNLERDLPPMPYRSHVQAERTSKYVPHVGKREKARRLKQLADQHARLMAKLESRG